jgi:hypothetical protein
MTENTNENAGVNDLSVSDVLSGFIFAFQALDDLLMRKGVLQRDELAAHISGGANYIASQVPERELLVLDIVARIMRGGGVPKMQDN